MSKMGKSALTAALTGAPADPTPPPSGTKRNQLDLSSFPCLTYAAEIDKLLGRPVSEEPPAFVGSPEEEELDRTEMLKFIPVGSAPTNTVLNGVELVRGRPPPIAPVTLLGFRRAHHHHLHQQHQLTQTLGSVCVAQADYPLNPFRRRGGQEVPPEFGASVVSPTLPLLLPSLCGHPPVLGVGGNPGALHLPACTPAPPLHCYLQDRLGSGASPRASAQGNFVSHAVIGSLPKGMTDMEKSKVLQHVPQSPSAALLKEMPRVGGWVGGGRGVCGGGCCMPHNRPPPRCSRRC